MPKQSKFQEALAEWREIKKWLKEGRERENQLREFLIKECFAQLKEGVNTKEVDVAGVTEVVKATRKIDRKIDEPALVTMTPQFRKYGVPVDDLVDSRPVFRLEAYRELDPNKQKYFEKALTIKDAATELKIEPKPAK